MSSSEKFVKSLSIATDEVSQVQPLYREEIVKAVNHSDTVNIDGVFASNGKLVEYPEVRMKEIQRVKTDESGNVYLEKRKANVSDIIVKGTDGLFEMEYLKINDNKPEYIGFMTLLECKLDQDFNDKNYRASVILQCICYLKQIAEEGTYEVPEAIVIGSKKNCFVLSKSVVSKYIDMPINGYTSASTAYEKNPDIVLQIAQDEDITSQCFIRNIDDRFEMHDVIKDIYAYVSNTAKDKKMTEAMLSTAFDIFSMQVLTKADKIDGRQQAKYFLKLILEPDSCYQHPKKPNKLVIGDDTVDIDGDKYLAFRAQYGVEKSYSLTEQREFTAIADRLIEDADRRRRGDFYTPTIWVNEAHKLISKHLGNNWRNEYMVWDCACYTMDMRLYVRNILTDRCYFTNYEEISKNPDNYECYAYNKRTNTWSWKKFIISVRPEVKKSNDFYTFEFRPKSIEECKGNPAEEMLSPRVIVKVTSDHKMCVNVNNEGLKSYTAKELVSKLYYSNYHEATDLFLHNAEPRKDGFYYDEDFIILTKDIVTAPACIMPKQSGISLLYSDSVNANKKESTFYLHSVRCIYDEPVINCKKRAKYDEEPVWCVTVNTDNEDEHNILVCSENDVRGNDDTIMGIACGNCGTMNLTRDYKFKDLYASTLIESDLTLSEKYNTNATKFQYDFLNDDVDIFEELARRKALNGSISVTDFMELSPKLYQVAPSLIQGLLSGKKLLFFINPPYATSGEMSSAATGKEKKAGVSVSAMNELMKTHEMGASSQQLYAQFIYRILRFKELFGNNIILGIFSPTLLLCGLTFVTLTNELNRLLPYTCGFVLCASEFANVKSNWGISFTFWGAIDKANDFKTQVMQFNADNMSVTSTQTKNYRAVTSDISASDWCKSGTKDKDIKYYLAPQFTSALQYKEKGTGKWCNDALGYIFTAAANKVEFNNQFCSLFTAPFANAHGWVLREVNFINTITYFAARRLITGPYATWINCKDEYMIPNTAHQDYAQFEADSIVYSLFNNASNQSSLRDIEYNNKQWDIKNEFFWLSRAEMQALADGTDVTYGSINNDIEQDLINNADDERYVYKQLQQVTLSADAKAVLDKATELIKKSFKYRKTVAALHPEYHLNTWDMGYYQLNKLIQDCGDAQLQAEFKTFRALYKSFEDRLRPLVYTLGFLYP